jgi:tetratricopeptide (TPR) repeat protein
MAHEIPIAVREFERWLRASVAEAETLVPDLLGLPGPLLLAELRRHPELRTAGVMRRLLAVAREGLPRFPSRAHELTAIVARYARSMLVPPEFTFAARTIQGEAWREHASALREIGRTAKAGQAVRLARKCFEDTPGSSWLLATVDLIEAPLLHDRGLHTEALQMIRGAGDTFRRSRDHGKYLEARMIESWMLWAGGDRTAAAEVWSATAEAARRRGDVELLARLAARMGVFELRYGSTEEASRLLAAAVELFGTTPASEDSVRARWNLAEALAERGRLHEAISEYHKVRAELLARGALIDGAIAAVEILDLHLLAGRESELSSLTERFVHLFRDAGLPLNAMEALAYLRGRAAADGLTHDDLAYVRAFFEDVVQKPYARFIAP